MRTINLLPPEARLRAQSRRRRSVLIGVIFLYVLLLTIGALYWRTKVTAAEQRLETQQAINAELQAEIARLENARALQSTYEEKVALLEVLLAADVAWGRLLNDLGRVIPDRVWLTTFSGQVQVTPDNPADLGSISADGVAFEYPDVASWLRTVDSDQFPALAGAWVNSATLGEIGEAPIVNFGSVARLTQHALSDRFAERVPEVPE